MTKPADAIPEPPSGWNRLAWVGPGFLWMVSAAGSGELLFTPRIGALYGYALLWALIAAVAMKWFINREIGRYAVCKGESVLRGFATLDVSNRLAHTTANRVVNNQARICAQTGRRLATLLVMLARERAHDQEPPANQLRVQLAERDTTDDGTEFQTGTPGSFSSTTPMTSHRAGLFSSPTTLRAADPSDEITTR